MTMFDDFRQQAADESAFDDTSNEQGMDSKPTRKLSFKLPRQAPITMGGGPEIFLGMTAPQRLVIAIMVLMMTCTMGFLILLVTEKMALAF